MTDFLLLPEQEFPASDIILPQELIKPYKELIQKQTEAYNNGKRIRKPNEERRLKELHKKADKLYQQQIAQSIKETSELKNDIQELKNTILSLQSLLIQSETESQLLKTTLQKTTHQIAQHKLKQTIQHFNNLLQTAINSQNSTEDDELLLIALAA